LCQRGFDQTELLARGLAKKLNLPYQKTLKRRRYTKTQAQLSKTDRQKNLHQAFAALRQAQDKNILLIDDVATTGSTLHQAALALKKSGAANITCLVIAKN
jgi:ComF family protein